MSPRLVDLGPSLSRPWRESRKGEARAGAESGHRELWISGLSLCLAAEGEAHGGPKFLLMRYPPRLLLEPRTLALPAREFVP